MTTFVHFTSPGVTNRGAGYLAASSLCDRVIKGFLLFIQKQFYLSFWIMLFLIAGFLIMLFHKRKSFFIVNLLYLIPFLVCIIFMYFIDLGQFSEHFSIMIMPGDYYQWRGLAPEVIYVMLYYIGMIILLAFDVFYLFFIKHSNIFFIITLGVCSLMALIPIAEISTRVAYPSIYLMIITVSYLFSECIYSKNIVVLIIISSLYCLISDFPSMKKNIEVGIQREKIYQMILNNKELNYIEIPRYEMTVHGNFDDPESWQYKVFEAYFSLENKTVIFYD